MVLRMKMSGGYAIASPVSRLSQPGAAGRILLALLIVSALFIPPLWLLTGFALVLVLIVVKGTPSPEAVRFPGAVFSRISPRSPPLPA
jgi:hypothetical protein